MQPEVLAGLLSAGVGAVAIATSTLTAFRSIDAQRAATTATLDAQRALAEVRERAVRDRSRTEELRSRRAPVYGYLIRWADDLLGALDQMAPGQDELPRSAWHIEPAMQDTLDLWASDGVHTHFNALRGLLIGLVEGSHSPESPVVTWDEHDGQISNVRTTRTPALTDWPARQQVRDQAHASALDLIHRIREEVQGERHSGYFVTYRLDR